MVFVLVLINNVCLSIVWLLCVVVCRDVDKYKFGIELCFRFIVFLLIV